MLKFNKIEKLIIEERVCKKSMAKKIGTTEQSLRLLLNGDIANPGMAKIEAIADFFRVPLDYFFEREVEVREDMQAQYEKEQEIRRLKELMAEKERTIQILMKGRYD